jgi:osmotically inducible protein OsmC
MATNNASAVWNGTLKEGSGTMKLGNEPNEFPFTFASRFEDGKETNPEELIGAAHAGCFSMFLSAVLSGDDLPPTRITTSATVHLGDGPTITTIELETEADVPNIEDAKFQEYVANAKENCPVSKALAAVTEIKVNAKLV